MYYSRCLNKPNHVKLLDQKMSAQTNPKPNCPKPTQHFPPIHTRPSLPFQQTAQLNTTQCVSSEMVSLLLPKELAGVRFPPLAPKHVLFLLYHYYSLFSPQLNSYPQMAPYHQSQADLMYTDLF